jgi:anti-sigma28 factor (negative regulator of flagellin synthesis)
MRPWIFVCGFGIAMVSTAAGDDKAASTATKSLPAKSKAKPDVVPGYELRMIEGFSVLINRKALEEIDKAKGNYEIDPLEVLENELRALNTILIPKVLKPLQTVRIFVEWDDTPPGTSLSEEEKARGSRVVAVYRSGSPLRAAQEGKIHPLKMNAVEIMTLKRLTEMHQPGKDKDQIILLHELCHTVHHVFLTFENRDVKAAFQQAMDRHLYDKAYARTNAHEYFAEISCAYLDRCNHAPHDAAELKDYDPVGYRLMEQTWGKQEMIQKLRDKVAAEKAAREKAKKRAVAVQRLETKPEEPKPVDAEKTAAAKLELIKLQIKDGKVEKAKERLADLIKSYPETTAGKEAKKLLDTL